MADEQLVTLDEVAHVLGFHHLDPPPGWRIHLDWAQRPSMTVRDAGRFVAEFREELAREQRKQEQLNASRASREEAKQRAEWLTAAKAQRESRREAAIQRGGREAVAALKGLITPERQVVAYADGSALAAELFDARHPALT